MDTKTNETGAAGGGQVDAVVMHFPFVECRESGCNGPGVGKCSECQIVPINKQTASLLREVMMWHSDKESSDYNGCDKSPCLWCENATRLLKIKRCRACNETGALHCANPESCGGPWDDHKA